MWNFKDENSSIFTADNSNKPLEREAFTNLINQFIRNCARKIDSNTNLSSHSFRIGFLTKLWRDTNDIEFVKQSIGHAKIDTTSLYVEHIPDEDRKQRMENISFPKDLFMDLNNKKD
jgi:site-specific recombinase XerD